MSSRILRPGDPTPAPPHVFRSVFGPPVRQAPRLSPVAFPETQDATAMSDAEIQARIDAARQQAYADGEAQGSKQAAAKLDSALQSLGRIIEELAAQRKRLRAEAEEDTVKLALAIARRILHREIAIDPDAMHGIVKAAFDKLNARELHRLRVTPVDAVTLESNRDKLHLPAAVTIVADATLPVGSAIFETTRGEMNASIDTQLSEIDRGLTDVLRRRSQ